MSGEGGRVMEDGIYLLALHSPAFTASHVTGVISLLVRKKKQKNHTHSHHSFTNCTLAGIVYSRETDTADSQAKKAHSEMQHPLTREKSSVKQWVCVVVTAVSFLLWLCEEAQQRLSFLRLHGFIFDMRITEDWASSFFTVDCR